MKMPEAVATLLEITRLRLVAADAMHEAMMLDKTTAHLREQSAANLRKAEADHAWAKGLVAVELQIAAQASHLAWPTVQ